MKTLFLKEHDFLKRLEINRALVFLLISASCILLIFLYRNFNGPLESDALLYGEVARNIIQGNGISTNISFPFEINSITKLNHPYFLSSPLQPVLVAVLFKIFGIKEWAIILPGMISFILISAAIYYLGKKAFDRKVGFLAALLFVSDTNMLRYAINGMAELTYACFLIAGIYFLYKAKSSVIIFLSGILFGFCQLARQNSFIFLWIFLIYICFAVRERALINSIIFLAGFIIISFFEFYRVFLITKGMISPIYSQFIYAGTCLVPAGSSLVMLKMVNIPDLSFVQYIFSYPGDFLKKYLFNLKTIMQQLPLLINPYKMAFFIVGCFKFKAGEKSSSLKIIIYGIILTQIASMPVFLIRIRHFLPFVPLIMLLIASFMVYLFDNLLIVRKASKVLICIIFGFLIVSPLVFQLIFGSAMRREETFYTRNNRAELKNFLLKNTEPGSFIVSDLFEIISWETGRYTVWIPVSVDLINDINKKFEISYILLSSERTIGEWKEIVSGNREINGFELKDEYINGNLKAVIYARV